MGAAAGVAGLAIAGGLAVGLTDSVKAAEAGQASTERLNLAFKNSGESASKYAGQISQAEDSGRKLGFSNIETRDSLASLEVATHNHTLALKSMGVAEDLARYKHIDLEQATKSLTMAQTGSQRALKQLGLTFPPVTSAQDALTLGFKNQETAIRAHYSSLGTLTLKQKEQENAALDQASATYKEQKATAKSLDTQKTAAGITDLLSQKLHGQADAYAHTAQGGVAVMHANVEALEESLGNALIPALTDLSGIMAKVTGFFADNAGITKILVAGMAVLGGTLLAVSVGTKLVTAATTIWSAATKVAEGAQWLLNAALDANPIGLVVVAIGALVAAFVIAYKHSETFRDTVLGVWDALKTGTTTVLNFFAVTIPQTFQRVLDWFRGNWPEIAVLLSGPFAPIVALATNGFGIRDKLIQAFRDVKDWFQNIWSDVKSLVKAPFTALEATAGGAFGIPDLLQGAFKSVRSWFDSTWSDVTGFIKAPFVAAKDAAKDGFGLQGVLSAAWRSIKSDLQDAFGAIGSSIARVVVAPINAIIDKLRSFDIGVHIGAKKVLGITVFPGIDFDVHPFADLPELAKGGIVSRPTVALLGEAGPEAVVPLPGGRGAGGLGTDGSQAPIHITVGPVYGTVDPGFARQLADQIATQLRGGRSPQLQQAIHAI